MAGIRPFSWGHFGIVPDPPEYDELEFEGCQYGYSDIDEGDECLCCQWYEVCKDMKFMSREEYK